MIDQITLLGPWRTPQEASLSLLPWFSITRKRVTKAKHARHYVNSPLTGKQITVEALGAPSGDGTPSSVKIKIPLASVLMGHNWLHGGLGVLKHEVACLQPLVRIVLCSIGFSEVDAEEYLKTAIVDELEVTWHSWCSSAEARDKSFRRTEKRLEAQAALTKYRDIEIRHLTTPGKSSSKSLYVPMKSGAVYKQYRKDLQINARGKDERLGRLDSEMVKRLKRLVTEVLPLHNRHELLFPREHLRQAGIDSLETLTAKRLRPLIDATWTKLAGHLQRADFAPETLSPSARRYYKKYVQQGTLPLTTSRGSRARRDIMGRGGPDIAIPRRSLRFDSAAHWDRLSYDSRWRIDGYTRLVVSRNTVDRLLEELKKGLVYIRDGERPELPEHELKAWIERWRQLARPQVG